MLACESRNKDLYNNIIIIFIVWYFAEISDLIFHIAYLLIDNFKYLFIYLFIYNIRLPITRVIQQKSSEV